MGIDISLWRGWYCHCFSHTGIPKEFELYFTDYEFSQNHLGWKSPPRTSQARSPPEHWVSHPGRNQQHFLGFLWHKPALCGLPITHCLLFHSSALALSVLWMLQLFRVQVKQKVLIKSDTAAPCAVLVKSTWEVWKALWGPALLFASQHPCASQLPSENIPWILFIFNGKWLFWLKSSKQIFLMVILAKIWREKRSFRALEALTKQGRCPSKKKKNQVHRCNFSN